MRRKTLESIEYLTAAIKELPENQLQQVCNEKTLTPLLRAIFDLKISAKNHEEYKKTKELKEIRKKRLRMLRLARATLDIIGNYNFVLNIVPQTVRPYLKMTSPPLENFRALYYASLQED
jgi:transcriptional regulatory protein LevR